MSLLICTTLLSTSFSTSVLAQGQNADQGITTEQKMEKPSTLQLLQAKQKIQMVEKTSRFTKESFCRSRHPGIEISQHQQLYSSAIR